MLFETGSGNRSRRIKPGLQKFGEGGEGEEIVRGTHSFVFRLSSTVRVCRWPQAHAHAQIARDGALFLILSQIRCGNTKQIGENRRSRCRCN